MAEAYSEISILVAGGEYEAGDAALSTNGQLGILLKTLSETASLDCTLGIPGGQCRVEANASIDDESPSIVIVTTSCMVKGEHCGETCSGITKFLKSDYPGALCLDQEITFI